MTIDTSDMVFNADFAPATVAEEVMQNIRTLLSTLKGQVPLDRGFGIDAKVLDLPVRQAMAKLQIEIYESIQNYEPRAEVKSISFKGDNAVDGVLVPVVEVDIVAK